MSNTTDLTEVRFSASGLIAMLQQIAQAEDITELRPCKADRQAEHRSDRRTAKVELSQYVWEVE